MAQIYGFPDNPAGTDHMYENRIYLSISNLHKLRAAKREYAVFINIL